MCIEKSLCSKAEITTLNISYASQTKFELRFTVFSRVENIIGFASKRKYKQSDMQTVLTCVTAKQQTVPNLGRSHFPAGQRYWVFVHTEGLGELRVE